MNNICIIPARGGSKRIPKKNIKPFLGKPIIAFSSPTSELRKKVEDNNIGKWVQFGDAEGFADCVLELMKDRELAKSLGNNARNTLETEYSIEVAGKKYFDVLKLGNTGE